MKKDTILLFPQTCTPSEIDACESPISDMFALKPVGDVFEQTTDKICSLCVPKTCIRITCHGEMCRQINLAENQQNEHGNWVRLPCSSCKETPILNEEVGVYIWEWEK